MPRKRKEEVTVEPGKGLNLDPELIRQLVPGTLDRATINEQLAALKKAIFERALGGELTHHLGYGKGEAKPAGSTNHRNGISRKRITTDDDALDLAIPRDREGTFDPVLIAKGERRFTGFDQKIIAMYDAKLVPLGRARHECARDPGLPAGDVCHRGVAGLHQHGDRRGDGRGARMAAAPARCDVSGGVLRRATREDP